ncbi:C-C motif chemokine 3-like 1 [Caloenas nicobarica]
MLPACFHPRSLSPSIKWDEPGDRTAGTVRGSAAVQPDSCSSSPSNRSMETSTAALAVLFVAVLCYQVSSSPSSVNFSGRCCVQYSSKAFPSSRVLMYEHTGSHCSQPAVIFTTVAGKMVCGKPSDKWVQDIVNHQKDKAGSG